MYHTHNTAILSMRTLFGTLFMFVGVFICLGVLMLAVYTPCIYDYYANMIVYPDAQNVGQESSIVNYFGLGDLNSTWYIQEDAGVVRQWYRTTIAQLKHARDRAVIEHREVPPVWGGVYEVVPDGNGARIILSANCY